MPKGGALEDGVLVSRVNVKKTVKMKHVAKSLVDMFYFSVFFIFTRLTNTPRKTSGRGWTLVNVGLTMAIAILDEKWVRGEK